MGKQNNKNNKKNTNNKQQKNGKQVSVVTTQDQKRKDRETKKEFQKEKNKNRYQDSAKYKNDFKILLDQLAPYGLTITDVKPDGNCLFRVISHQLQGTQENFAQIRNEICDFVEENRDSFEPFVEDDVPWETYCSKMRKNKEWGGHIQLQAASLTFQVNISIYQANEARWDINNFPENTRKVHMSFHDNSHYASVHPSNELNSLNNKLVAKPKPKPAGPKPAIKSQNPKLSQMDIENLIKKMHNDTMLEEVIIQQTLESCDYNVDETYDILFNLRDQLFTLDSIDESQSPIIDETPQPPINTNSLTQEDLNTFQKFAMDDEIPPELLVDEFESIPLEFRIESETAELLNSERKSESLSTNNNTKSSTNPPAAVATANDAPSNNNNQKPQGNKQNQNKKKPTKAQKKEEKRLQKAMTRKAMAEQQQATPGEYKPSTKQQQSEEFDYVPQEFDVEMKAKEI